MSFAMLDACVDSSCQGGPALGCDDSDVCTADSCDASTGCSSVAINCDDGQACTEDSCDSLTGCSTVALGCDDSDACTQDGCDATSGCTYTDVACDDSNECTDDSCVNGVGCSRFANPGACGSLLLARPVLSSPGNAHPWRPLITHVLKNVCEGALRDVGPTTQLNQGI